MQPFEILMGKYKPWIVGGMFLISLMGLNLRAKPQLIQPKGFDAYSYIEMSENIVKARENVPEHHWQRLFGPLVVMGLNKMFGIDHRVGFRLVAITASILCLIAISIIFSSF